MKRLLLLTLTISLFIGLQPLISQTSLGIKGGYASAWMDYGDVELPQGAQTDIHAYNFSLTFYQSIFSGVSIGIEPGFARRGAACIPGWQPFFTNDAKVFLNYVELPLMVSAERQFWNDRLRLYGRLGYGVSQLRSAKEQRTIADSSGETVTRDVELGGNFPSINLIDHGIHTQLGLAYLIAERQRVFAEPAFYYGMRDFDRSDVSKNRSLSFNIGYAFSF